MRTREFIQRCLDIGMSTELAMQAAAAFDAEVEIILDLRRSKDRARQAKHRAKSAEPSRDVTLDNVTNVTERDQKVSPTPPSKTNPSDEGYITTREADFAAFWAAYPRKVGKGAARKAYFGAIRKTGADPPTLMAALAAAKALGFGSELRFTPHAATWLHDERWLDEPEPIRPRLVHERSDPLQRKRDQFDSMFAGAESAARRRLERAGG